MAKVEVGVALGVNVAVKVGVNAGRDETVNVPELVKVWIV
jgi:hypothetical protein